MHTDEFILMNIHEDVYFRVMVIKLLMFFLLGEKTDGIRQPKANCVAALQADANNLANAGGFEGCYLRN